MAFNGDAKVYVHTNDILGKRTALFGMTRRENQIQ